MGEILLDELLELLDSLFQGRFGHSTGQVFSEPSLEEAYFAEKLLQSPMLLSWIVPVDVERCLETRFA